jgi:hypothetical protein
LSAAIFKITDPQVTSPDVPRNFERHNLRTISSGHQPKSDPRVFFRPATASSRGVSLIQIALVQ